MFSVSCCTWIMFWILFLLCHETDFIPVVLIIGEPLKGCTQCFVCKLWAYRSVVLNNVTNIGGRGPIRMTKAACLLSKLVSVRCSGFEEVSFMWYFNVWSKTLNISLEWFVCLLRVQAGLGLIRGPFHWSLSCKIGHIFSASLRQLQRPAYEHNTFSTFAHKVMCFLTATAYTFHQYL